MEKSESVNVDIEGLGADAKMTDCKKQQSIQVKDTNPLDSADNQLFGDQNDDEGFFDLEVKKDYTAEETIDLAAFLAKAQKACNEDKSVPSCVGEQLSDWLKEMEDEKPKEEKEE